MNALLESSTLINIVVGLVGLVMLVLSADEVVKRLVGLAGYFNLSTILGSALFSAGQVRQLIPLYEKYVLQQFANRFAIKTGI